MKHPSIGNGDPLEVLAVCPLCGGEGAIPDRRAEPVERIWCPRCGGARVVKAIYWPPFTLLNPAQNIPEREAA